MTNPNYSCILHQNFEFRLNLHVISRLLQIYSATFQKYFLKCLVASLEGRKLKPLYFGWLESFGEKQIAVLLSFSARNSVFHLFELWNVVILLKLEVLLINQDMFTRSRKRMCSSIRRTENRTIRRWWTQLNKLQVCCGIILMPTFYNFHVLLCLLFTMSTYSHDLYILCLATQISSFSSQLVASSPLVEVSPHSTGGGKSIGGGNSTGGLVSAF